MHLSNSNPTSRPLVIVTSGMPSSGETGVQTHFNSLIQYLRGERHPVEFVGPDEAKGRYLHLRLVNRLVQSAIGLRPEAAYACMRRINIYATRRELRRRLGRRPAWCVYAQDPTTALAALSLRTSPAQRVVLAVHFNVSQADEMVNRGIIRQDSALCKTLRRQEHFVLNAVDTTVVFSRFMQTLLKPLFDSEDTMVLIPNTADVPKPSVEHACRDLVAIGSLEPRKNQAFLLRVLAEAKARGYRYSLDMVGSGESLVSLQKLAGSLGIEDQVLFLGRIAGASSLLSRYKMLVHSALVDNMPIALIEALAAGVPILAPAVGGIPEIFRDGIEGLYWNIADVQSSTDRLIAIMEDEEERMRMSECARDRYAQNFAPSKVFARLSSVLYGAA